jgi:hypothetical protein
VIYLLVQLIRLPQVHLFQCEASETFSCWNQQTHIKVHIEGQSVDAHVLEVMLSSWVGNSKLLIRNEVL